MCDAVSDEESRPVHFRVGQLPFRDVDLAGAVDPWLARRLKTYGPRQMRIAAAIKWYELGKISQNKAAEIAGLSRSDFIDSLSMAKVSPLQITPEQLKEELTGSD